MGFKPTDFENRGFKKRGQKWVKIAAGGSAGVQQGGPKVGVTFFDLFFMVVSFSNVPQGAF